MQLAIIICLALAASVHAHLAAFTKGMYCLNVSIGRVHGIYKLILVFPVNQGSAGNNLNSDDPNLPLYDLEFDQWWSE